MNTPKSPKKNPEISRIASGSRHLFYLAFSAYIILMQLPGHAAEYYHSVRRWESVGSILRQYPRGARIVHMPKRWIRPGSMIKIQTPDIHRTPQPRTVYSPIPKKQPTQSPKPQTKSKAESSIFRKYTSIPPTSPPKKTQNTPSPIPTKTTPYNNPPIKAAPVRIEQPTPPKAAPHTYPPSNISELNRESNAQLIKENAGNEKELSLEQKIKLGQQKNKANLDAYFATRGGPIERDRYVRKFIQNANKWMSLSGVDTRYDGEFFARTVGDVQANGFWRKPDYHVSPENPNSVWHLLLDSR